MNRLKLNWALSSAEERSNFLMSYLDGLPFEPSSDELEMCANYVLWGKDENGQNPAQNGEILLEGKSKTWTREKPTESLDELLESPTFNEATFRPVTAPPIKTSRKTFSREDALKKAPVYLKDTLRELFRQIDELDLEICYYDLEHGKRKNPPRSELLERFTKEEQEKLRQRALHWNQRVYLKKRHLLVELRREQFTIRDSFVFQIQRETQPLVQEPILPPTFGEDVRVLPLGARGQKIAPDFFREKNDLNPESFSEEELKKISKFLWRKNDDSAPYTFDFREVEHVYQLFLALEELRDDDTESIRFLIDTLEYYIELADLDDIQKEILDMKIKKMKNCEIAEIVNRKYGKSYTANYISTIFKQRIIPKINNAAKLHQEIVENIFFEEEFKKCSMCGTWYLRNTDFFVKRTKSKDGLTSRCKKCDKKVRDLKKAREVKGNE